MEIKKIRDRIEPKGQFDVELQGCLDDCTEYFGKYLSDWRRIASQGYKADGSETQEQMAEIKKIFGVYCFQKKTAKDTSLW